MKTGVSETSRSSASNLSNGDDAPFPSDKFDEHERDTAQRAYPREIVEGTKRTTKMPKLDLAALRTESGTRPALSHDAIERHVREKMEDAFADVHRSSDIEVDPHSRPTIAAGIPATVPPKRDGEWSPDSLAASTPRPFEPAADAPRATPLAVASSRAPSIPGWAVGFIVLGLVFLVSAAGTVGFILGRRSAAP